MITRMGNKREWAKQKSIKVCDSGKLYDVYYEKKNKLVSGMAIAKNLDGLKRMVKKKIPNKTDIYVFPVFEKKEANAVKNRIERALKNVSMKI